MALKDWKKVKELINFNGRKGNFFIQWNTISNSKYIDVFGKSENIQNSYIWVGTTYDSYPNNKGYQVRIGKWNKLQNNYPSKDYEFKTKTKALAFAKDYMRRH